MREATITILPPLKDQKTKVKIDPKGVRMPSASEYPLLVYRNFDRRQVIGLANNVRLTKEGALVADARFDIEITRMPRFEPYATDARLGSMVSLIAISTVEPSKRRPADG